MPFLSAVVTLICACSSDESVRGSLCELESSGAIEVYWVSWGHRRGFLRGDMESCFGVDYGSSVDQPEVGQVAVRLDGCSGVIH